MNALARHHQNVRASRGDFDVNPVDAEIIAELFMHGDRANEVQKHGRSIGLFGWRLLDDSSHHWLDALCVFAQRWQLVGTAARYVPGSDNPHRIRTLSGFNRLKIADPTTGKAGRRLLSERLTITGVGRAPSLAANDDPAITDTAPMLPGAVGGGTDPERSASPFIRVVCVVLAIYSIAATYAAIAGVTLSSLIGA